MRWLLLLAIACNNPLERHRDEFWRWMDKEGADLAREINVDLAVERIEQELQRSHPHLHLHPGKHPNEHTLTVTEDEPGAIKAWVMHPDADGWKFQAATRQ